MADAAESDQGSLEKREALSVGELNDRVAGAIDVATYLDDVVCRGEVSDLHESGSSVFFTLSDADGSHELNCFMYQSEYRGLELELVDGIEVVVDGEVDYWTQGGRLNLRPTEITPVGEGALQAHIDQLRSDLQTQGWFDPDRKQELPQYPECVGVVTSRDGDARYDIQDKIHSRHPGVDIVLHHASVQGDRAPEALADGITTLDREEKVDVVIAGRGGGSTHDLLAFNTEEVAAAIFKAETPIVSAVGHRENTTIACEVADVAAITPTAAGTLVRERDAALRNIAEQEAAIDTAYASVADEQLERSERQLDHAYRGIVNDRLAQLERRLDHAYRGIVDDRLDRLESRVSQAYQQREHEEAVEEAEQTVPLGYAVALVVLVLVVLVLVIVIVL